MTNLTLKGKRLLFIDTGHKHQIVEAYQEKLSLLSRQHAGTVLTTGEIGVFRISAFEVHSYRILPRRKALEYIRTLWNGLQLIRKAAIAGQPYDVVVAYDPLATGLISLLLGTLGGIPFVVEFNGDVTSPSNYTNIKRRSIAKIKRYLYMKIAGAVAARAAGVKLLYARQIDAFRRKLRKDVEILVFPNFLPLRGFLNLGETPVVSLIGFPFEVKGVDIAVEAFSRVAQKHPDWRLEILGWYVGDEKCRLDACIDGSERVSHHAPIMKSAMPSYVGNTGIVVCASRTEGFPRVIKEAMHAAKPCIVSNVGGLPDAIIDDENGLIFPIEDVGQLAAKLDRLMGDQALRRRLGEKAQEYALKMYTDDAYLEQFSRLVSAVTS